MTAETPEPEEEYEQCCGCTIGGDHCQCLCCCGRVMVGGIRWSPTSDGSLCMGRFA